MEIFSGDDILDGGSVVTIGSYDGVHYGHRQILNELFEKSKQYDAKGVVLTLFPHPREVLNLDISSLRLLNTLEEKKYLLDKCGLDVLYIAKFDKEFSELSGEQYIKQYLVDRLKAKAVIVGYDHQFGKNRENGFEFLSQMGKKYGFDLYEIPKQDLDTHKISSTSIRKLLEGGDIQRANKYLSEPYLFITQIDKDGYFLIEPMKLVPLAGEYRAEVSCDNILRICTLTIRSDKLVKIDSFEQLQGKCIVKIMGRI